MSETQETATTQETGGRAPKIGDIHLTDAAVPVESAESVTGDGADLSHHRTAAPMRAAIIVAVAVIRAARTPTGSALAATILFFLLSAFGARP